MALDQNAESTYWAPECTDQNGNWWIKFTISQHETMLGVGLMPYGDRIHDVIDYDVFRCDAQPITSAHLISASCTELMKKCNATIGQTSEQTCEGWGPHTVGPDFGLRIRSTGGMVEPLLPHGLPYLYEAISPKLAAARWATLKLCQSAVKLFCPHSRTTAHVRSLLNTSHTGHCSGSIEMTLPTGVIAGLSARSGAVFETAECCDHRLLLLG
ncbi:hypothetical protein CYMTET_42201 [Cymbomonas tetramitiformis]|uniref:Uncharacterized protein n=1 Tax=Cymbomonas tetramitiformis TaxID=36881 RepID=A0AAE0C5X2_9CHLO|nr:hypothetical protein CYMTET_42201 [Cymbomonas tetramitiformis]